MRDILIPSLFVGILLAFIYVNLYLAASFIELKNNPEARLKLNPKVVFLSVLLIYPTVSVVTLLIGYIYAAINNLFYYYLFLIPMAVLVTIFSYFVIKHLKAVLIGFIGFLILNIFVLPLLIN
jgi:small-conductance mechanosensitive channel|tara:strand:- start:448 stop:816 length:369 start_codon:yes stop_codon:yes gene_type:complete